MKVPPIFRAVEDAGEITEEELYQVFNMGHRMEICCDESFAGRIIDICTKYHLPARKIGYTEKLKNRTRNEVVIRNGHKEFTYDEAD